MARAPRRPPRLDPLATSTSTSTGQPAAESTLAIVWRRLDELIPYVNNARTHSAEQVDQLAASIREFGWTAPLLLDGSSGVLAGHGRILAARQLGLDRAPCIDLAHLSPAQRRAYVIADNQLALNAGWDMELLRRELGELQATGFDLPLIGFDDWNLSLLLGQVEPAAAEEQSRLDERTPIVCPACGHAFRPR